MKKLSLLFLSILSILLSCNKPPSLIGKWEMFIGSPSDYQSLGTPVKFSTGGAVLVTEADHKITFRGSYHQDGRNLNIQVPLPIGTWVWQGKIVTLAKNKLVLRRPDGKLAAYHKVGEKWDSPPRGLMRSWSGKVIKTIFTYDQHIFLYQVNFSSRECSMEMINTGKFYLPWDRRLFTDRPSPKKETIKSPYHGLWIRGKYIIKGKGIPTFTFDKKLNILKVGKFTLR